MKNLNRTFKLKKAFLLALAVPLASAPFTLQARGTAIGAVNEVVQPGTRIVDAYLLNPTTVQIVFADKQQMTMQFYGENIVRIFQDPAGGIIRDPKASPEAQILVDNPVKTIGKLKLDNASDELVITTANIAVRLAKEGALMTVTNLKTGKVALESLSPVVFDKKNVSLSLKEHADEYFYGGGVQNGRFSHKGKTIEIVNTNSWVDGGVASPTPFYWSTNGYGVMWHTFKPGAYDFGEKEPGKVTLSHEENYLDIFVMVNDSPVALLNDFYQLTGNPVLLPKFGFYEGHLNAYNRDYWKEDPKGKWEIDGIHYSEDAKPNGGIQESLNGEKNNYKFSARAALDRYLDNDMPLGWFLPNDGYGAGYGQTGTLDGNVQNLKEFGEYAREKGVEIGLWTQSDLHPKEGVEALLQRDIVKEVRDAGVRVLKTDVAWVGAGYSFGLNGVADVAQIMPYYGNNARPFIISLDGWAGTQRYAGIWSGDQTGGKWEYIRFHIPTYIGSGLSGQPNISSDMDGIFGGKNMPVNIRDFQWKTFTPMELNMDGWGDNAKYPQALGEPATSINRWYLKMKSEMMPYTYSIAREAVDGKPMIRAMFLDYPNTYTLGKSTQYQFMYGPSLLIAPIYQATKSDEQGNDVRNGIYLPEGEWIDYFNGDVYAGNRIINNYEAPIWKLPIFVKNGAIIPMTHSNNNVKEIDKAYRAYEIYPSGHSSFIEYDDDGVTEEYRWGKSTTTLIESNVEKGNAIITIHPTEGTFEGFVKEKKTDFCINVTAAPKKVSVKLGKQNVRLQEVSSRADFEKGADVYFYDEAPEMNRFATPGSDFEKVKVTKNPQLLVRLAATDVTASAMTLKVEGFVFEAKEMRKATGTLSAPQPVITEENTQPYTLKPTWNKVANADYYEIEAADGMLYSTITDAELLFEDLKPETEYAFNVRAVNRDGVSDWAAVKAMTKANPLEFAIQGIMGETSCENQGGAGINRLFDFDETNLWHTHWDKKVDAFDIVADLKTFNQLDKFHYLPRENAGNGNILKGTVYYSMDKEDWKEAGTFEWKRDAETKTFTFDGKPTARYVKIAVSEAVGGFGTGRELYIFKVPGTESLLPGDINKDKLVDENDLTSYMNYTGLRTIDSDFDYISLGDINKNGLIDAYDISVVATQLEDGASMRKAEPLAGQITLSADKKSYAAGETVEITVKASGLKSVNALSFALPYNVGDYEFVAIEAKGMKQMTNLTKDRLHSNGEKALYPTFVNVGDKETLDGEADLFVIKLKAKQNVKFNLKAVDGIMVDKHLNSLKF